MQVKVAHSSQVDEVKQALQATFEDIVLDVGRLPELRLRITSYNVCYTKLLRIYQTLE